MPAEPSFDGAITWITTGESGCVVCASVGGVAVSGDRGGTWSRLGDLPGVFTLGFGQAENGLPNLLAGTSSGIHRWDDRTGEWLHILGGVAVNTLARVVVGRNQTMLAGTEQHGIVRSADGGSTWEFARAGLLDDTVLCLAVSPNSARDGRVFAGTLSGLYESKTGGKSWSLVEIEDDEPVIASISVASTAHRDGLIAVGTEAHGVFLLRDREPTWRRIPEFAASGVSALHFPPFAERRILAAVDSQVWVSQDSGLSWTLAAELADVVMCFASVADSLILAGTSGGTMLRSNDGGNSWERVRRDS